MVPAKLSITPKVALESPVALIGRRRIGPEDEDEEEEEEEEEAAAIRATGRVFKSYFWGD